jgi:formate dehydrogenase major subunit
VLVTDRIPPIEVQGRTTHQVGLPYHWGTRGLTTGGSANDLSSVALDPNVHIQEVKAFSVGIKPGRRPRGRALTEFVARIREQGQNERDGAERVEPESVKDTQP